MNEKKYVEIDEAIKEIYRFDGYLDEDMIWRLHYALRKLPTADVRHVVTCRDCKHYELDNGWCEYFDTDRVFKDYCSEGEKREES